MLHLLNHCAETISTTHSQLTLATLCDLSKAFDTISHDILLHRLNVFRIRGVAIKWIESYLTNMNQYVNIDSHISQNVQVRCDVPQIAQLKLVLSFSDDTTAFLCDADSANLFNTANSSLEAVFN